MLALLLTICALPYTEGLMRLHHLSRKPVPVVPPEFQMSFLQTDMRLNEVTLDRDGGNDSSAVTLSSTLGDWQQDVFQRSNAMGCSARANSPVQQENAKRCLWLPENTSTKGEEHLTSIPTYYITMGGERAQKWFSKYQRFTSELHVVNAVRGSEQTTVEEMVTSPYSKFAQINPGVLGCTLSHMRAIKQAYDSGAEVALVLEDDAVPDLAPWWPQSLEAYIASLPEGWQLSQLSWTTEESQAWRKYTGTDVSANTSDRFSKGAFWGTVAYLIHRRGMERVLSQLWEESKGKFDVSQMASQCSFFTADDCLLSCSTWPELSQWLPGNKGMLDQTYKAVPPMFTSYEDGNSMQTEGKQWVVKSYCDDIHSALEYSKTRCTVA